MFDVCVVRCESYEQRAVTDALRAVLEPLGGLEWVKPGMRVGVKANLVTFLKPDRAATTHPAVLCALTELLRERGAEVIVGDSPGGLYTAAYVNRVYSATGMRAVEQAGAALNRDFREKQVSFPEGKVAREFTYTSWLDGVDAIVDVCKLKSHGMMSMSAAVKNLFGAIPGTFKPEYHFKYPSERDFADMLVDLNEYFRPKLSIADAIVGMEGNGPTAGTPRPIGALLAAHTPYALDLACADIIGVTADDVPTIRAAHERGLCPASASELRICGDLAAVHAEGFQNILNHRSLRFQSAGPFGKVIERALASRPGVDSGKCIGCGVCANTCPAHAIALRNSRPVIDRRACIRCFCCQEFCPKGAMTVRRPLAARILNKSANKE